MNGKENEFGICPDDRPGLGSGSVPRYLRREGEKGTIDKPYLAYRPFERASNTNSAFSDVNGLRVELETI